MWSVNALPMHVLGDLRVHADERAMRAIGLRVPSAGR